MGDITPPGGDPGESANRVESGSVPLLMAQYPDSKILKPIEANQTASLWIETFNETIVHPDIKSLAATFLEESYWRDQLCLSWDFHTLKGPEKIFNLFSNTKTGCRIKSMALDKSSPLRSPSTSTLDAAGKVNIVQAFLTVETDVGRGTGVLRLAQEQGVWKAYTLFTMLRELNGFEPSVGKKRPFGVVHGEHKSRQNWQERRNAEETFEDGQEPTVLIVGAGQAGLSIAARLKMLNIKSLIVDREERIGDNWRSRYHQLVLHDPVWYDHLPYLPFPETWPVFTPKDKLGDWFEAYAKLMELNVWVRTSIVKSSWNEVGKKWTVAVDRILDGKIVTRELHPKHIIQATGHSGVPNIPNILGICTFPGTLIHSSQFAGASPSHGQGKKAVVIGCCNSAHDIAQDLYSNGYAVTMIQRSTTFVVSAETNLLHMAALYGEGGPPTEDADMLSFGLPNAVVKRMDVDNTKVKNETDGELLRGLEAAGFRTDKGPDESGLWIKYLSRGGGYYLDVGCSQLIIDGKISVVSGVTLTSISPTGVHLSNNTFLPADTIVLATGYQNMRSSTRTIFGDEVADKTSDVWGFDEEGEIRTMWRRSGHEGFWYMGGNLAMCRWFSRPLALMIKGSEEALWEYDD